MTPIEQKLTKYSRPYVTGEKRRPEYEARIRQETRLKNRYLILDELNNETPDTLKLNTDEKIQCRNLILTFNENWKYLHRRVSEETVILAFIFYINKIQNPKIRLEEYRICKKYKLTSPIFINIITRICNYYMKHSPINIRQTTQYNHDLLIKKGGY